MKFRITEVERFDGAGWIDVTVLPGGGVNAPGYFISFEGGEGAGKSTQVRRLQEWLTSEGLVAVEVMPG